MLCKRCMRHEIRWKCGIPARLGPKSVSPPSDPPSARCFASKVKGKGAFAYFCDLQQIFKSKAGPGVRTTGELSWPESREAKEGDSALLDEKQMRCLTSQYAFIV